jgi:hypothetical protein
MVDKTLKAIPTIPLTRTEKNGDGEQYLDNENEQDLEDEDEEYFSDEDEQEFDEEEYDEAEERDEVKQPQEKKGKNENQSATDTAKRKSKATEKSRKRGGILVITERKEQSCPTLKILQDILSDTAENLTKSEEKSIAKD